MDDIANRIASVRSRIDRACERSGRDPSAVTLIAVTKTHPAEAVAEAWQAGIRDFGENRVQEAAPKIEALRSRSVTPMWHLIGHLQRNKVNVVLGLFDILHSVDSVTLAEAISARAATNVRVLLQVNVARDAAKFGFDPNNVGEAAAQLSGLPHIDVAGLMTVAPQYADPEGARPAFRELRRLRDQLGLQELSMGMTDDFEVAVEEGSTLVRVGRAIFGDRPPAIQTETP